MRGYISLAFIELNYALLSNNPIGKNAFVVVLIIEAGAIVLYPFFMFLYIGKYLSPIRYIYE